MRHELFDLWIEAKRMLRDWRGAIDTANLAIARSPEPKYYVEQATAWFALAEEAQRAGQLTDAIVQYQRCGGLLAECIAEGKMKGLFADATELRRSAFVEAINLAKVVYRDPSSAIEVWDVCWRAFNAFVRLRSVIIDGVSNLLIWANHVTKFRDRVDESTVKKLEQGSYRLAKMNETLISRQWDDSVALQRIADGINTMERLVKLQVS
jgi:hypothetical protein